MQEVTMYTTAVCPYCVQAKRILKAKGVDAITEVRVDLEPQARQTMMERTGRRTVPQIFIGTTHVGGCDDLIALDARAGWAHSGGDGLLTLARNVGFGTATLGWQATGALQGLVQLDAHSALVRDTSLPFLSEAVLLTLGGRYRLPSGPVIEAGVVEDIQVNHSPDVSFQLRWRWAPGR